jgi:hypothetical protein
MPFHGQRAALKRRPANGRSTRELCGVSLARQSHGSISTFGIPDKDAERVTVGCQSDILIWGTETVMRKLIFGVAAAAVFFAGVSPTFAAKKMGPS